MIGGVCSGLAAYINTDPLLIRILFIIFFLGFSFLGTHIGGPIFMLLLYCVLWIMIPEAKTVEQKCAMRGEGVDLHNIQRRVEDGASKFSEYVRNSSSDSNSTMTKVSKVVTKIFAILFIISAIIGILSLTLLFLGIEIMNGFFPINLFDFVEFGITNPFWMKLLIILVLLLPLVWMFIVGIQTLAGSRARRFRPGLIIFIIWAISFFSLGIVGAIASKPFWGQATEEVSYALRGDLDTIYIQLESGRKMPSDNLLLEADHSSFNLLWVDESGKELVIFPEIDIIRQSEESSRELVCETSTMSNTYGEALLKGRNMPQCVDVKDSLSL
jgi:phage shock protein PspC (stress-responsive transcriptional regulator)